MTNKKLRFEPEYIIVNLVKADRKAYLHIGRLYKFVYYLWEQLAEHERIDVDSDVIFNVNFGAIERTVQIRNKVFDLVEDTIIIKVDNACNYITIPDNVSSLLSKYTTKFAEDYAV